jgi:hypothetical protein
MKLDVRKIAWIAVSFICGFMVCAMFVDTTPPPNGTGAFAMQQVIQPPQNPMRVLWAIRHDLPEANVLPVGTAPPSGMGHRLPWEEMRPNTDLIDTRPPRDIGPNR